MLADFFSPYVNMIMGGAYNIQQLSEGAAISFVPCSTRSPSEAILASCLSPAVPLNLIVGSLELLVVALIVALLIAGYVLNGKRGACAMLFVIALPGALGLVGVLPETNLAPDTIYLGGVGHLGRAGGFAVLMLIALLSGWALVVISYGLFRLTGNFRNYYDHIWYCAIVLTGAFFVYDVGLNKTHEDLQQENTVSQKASMYLRQQAKDYFQHCQQRGIQGIESCQWAAGVQQKLSEYANYNPTLAVSLGPKDDLEIYFQYPRAGSQEQSLKIRKQIEEYNTTVCPMTGTRGGGVQLPLASSICQRPPAVFCTAYPSPSEGLIDRDVIDRPVALASECIVPMLVQSRLKQEMLIQKVKSSKYNLRMRWLTFLALSFVAGGKIANATSKIASLDDTKGRQRRSIFGSVAKFLSFFKKHILWLISFAARMTRGPIRTVRAKWSGRSY